MSSGALVLKADQEWSLTLLLDEIKSRRAGTLVERAPIGSHQSVGTVERANREIAGMVRTMKGALEARIGDTLP